MQGKAHLCTASTAALSKSTIWHFQGLKNAFLGLSHPSQTFGVFLHSSLKKSLAPWQALLFSRVKRRIKTKAWKKKKKKGQAVPVRIATEAVFPIGLADRQKQISALWLNTSGLKFLPSKQEGWRSRSRCCLHGAAPSAAGLGARPGRGCGHRGGRGQGSAPRPRGGRLKAASFPPFWTLPLTGGQRETSEVPQETCWGWKGKKKRKKKVEKKKKLVPLLGRTCVSFIPRSGESSRRRAHAQEPETHRGAAARRRRPPAPAGQSVLPPPPPSPHGGGSVPMPSPARSGRHEARQPRPALPPSLPAAPPQRRCRRERPPWRRLLAEEVTRCRASFHFVRRGAEPVAPHPPAATTPPAAGRGGQPGRRDPRREGPRRGRAATPARGGGGGSAARAARNGRCGVARCRRRTENMAPSSLPFPLCERAATLAHTLSHCSRGRAGGRRGEVGGSGGGKEDGGDQRAFSASPSPGGAVEAPAETPRSLPRPAELCGPGLPAPHPGERRLLKKKVPPNCAPARPSASSAAPRRSPCFLARGCRQPCYSRAAAGPAAPRPAPRFPALPNAPTARSGPPGAPAAPPPAPPPRRWPRRGTV